VLLAGTIAKALRRTSSLGALKFVMPTIVGIVVRGECNTLADDSQELLSLDGQEIVEATMERQ
jgi:hypothetical protein